jgi:hypothetical protein
MLHKQHNIYSASNLNFIEYSVKYMYQHVYLAFNVEINAVYKDNSKESQQQNTVSTKIINSKFNTYYRSEMEKIQNTAT